jgi:arabinan endo-1,5-alpha-L-arabinosidase
VAHLRATAGLIASILGIVSAGDIWRAGSAASALPQLLELQGDVAAVHDPVAIKEAGTYYVFCTGGRNGQGVIPIRTSTDMRTWSAAGFVFDSLPEWATREIPKARNAWAPDIALSGGRYHLYYSVSSFGSRDSAIGLATTRTLDPSSPDYRWVDEGMVLRSHEDTDDWNAIDPNLVIEDRTHAWLVWGSFWSGIKMRRIDSTTGKLSTTDTTMYALSRRSREQPINGAVEAPFIVRHDRFWYLFVSFDRCCRGPASTYHIVVGRSTSVTGPYVDRAGVDMADGGGSLVLEATTPAWRGPGHPGFLRDAGRDYMFFHAYFGEGRGTGSALQISTVVWEKGWPRVGLLP